MRIRRHILYATPGYCSGKNTGTPLLDQLYPSNRKMNPCNLLLLIFCLMVIGCSYSYELHKVSSYELHKASYRGDNQKVNILLEEGADIETIDEYGHTALINAVLSNRTDTVKLLLERGADIEARGAYGHSALIFAAIKDRTDTVKLLLKKGANIEAKDDMGKTALINAALNDRIGMFKLLLESSANIEAKDEADRTALSYVSSASREKFISLAKKNKEKRAQSAELVVSDIQFQDYDSFCYHDKIFNAGEKANIEFNLKNDGKGIGFEVGLDIKCDSGEIETLNFQRVLGDIQPGENKKITIPIKAGLGLKNGKAAFLIQAKEKRGYHSRKVKFPVQTAALIPPKLEIQSVEINDGNIGQARGNGNGIPENNETIELIAYIKNSGTGDALGVDLKLDSINSGLNVINQKSDIGVIHPGQTVKGKLVISIPRTFQADQLRYKLKVDDVRGADSQSRQFALKFQRLSPVLAYDFRLYDGNSANSKGNKNGTVENGETVEIVITPKNTGDLEANRVTVSLEPPRSLNLNKSKASVGTILAHDSGDKKSFILSVPRTFQEYKITLNLAISQADFPSLNRLLELETKIILPRLIFTHRVTGDIMQGETPVLEVVVRNEGELDAHGVDVSIDIDTKGINLLTKQKSWGRLPAGVATDPLRFPFMIMRSADPGQLPIKINLTQTDFPSATQTLAFNIKEEGILEVAVEGGQTPTYSRPVRSITMCQLIMSRVSGFSQIGAWCF